MEISKLVQQLILHEGLRLKPYVDTVGKLTIGVGRNLDDRGVSETEALYLLQNDIEKHARELFEALPWAKRLDEVRQRVLIDMAFNMGVGGLLTFVNTLRHIKEGRYYHAARNMERSKWYRQVGSRAKRLVRMMETGEDYATGT